LENLSVNESRPIVIENKRRNIGKFLLLKFDEKTPRTMSISLEPCATLVGRLVDEDGVPLGGTHLEALPLPAAIFGPGSRPSFARPTAHFDTRDLFPAAITV